MRGSGRGWSLDEISELSVRKMQLNRGGRMPALGFGTLVGDRAVTVSATANALQAGFRHFDCAERYRNERQVGEALHAGIAAGWLGRDDLFVTTKLWNTNHRPDRAAPAFQANRSQSALDYLDLYLSHTPFAFEPGDEQDARDEHGNIIYDH